MSPVIQAANFCDQFKVNEKGKLMLRNAFSEISLHSLPGVAKHFIFLIVATIENKSRKSKFGVRVEDPSGRPLAEMEQGLGSNTENNVSPGGWDGLTHIGVFEFDGLPLPEAGEYHFEIFIDGQSIHTVPLKVNLVR